VAELQEPTRVQFGKLITGGCLLVINDKEVVLLRDDYPVY
jgi:hypothetical protein